MTVPLNMEHRMLKSFAGLETYTINEGQVLFLHVKLNSSLISVLFSRHYKTIFGSPSIFITKVLTSSKYKAPLIIKLMWWQNLFSIPGCLGTPVETTRWSLTLDKSLTSLGWMRFNARATKTTSGDALTRARMIVVVAKDLGSSAIMGVETSS